MLSFQRLEVYQRAMVFLALVAEITRRLPRGFASEMEQLKEASSSVVRNIAEAAGRTGAADAARCYAIARGSAMESASCLDVLRAFSVIEEEIHRRGMDHLSAIVAMLTKLCRPIFTPSLKV